jgi:hypothetical protein
MTALSRLKALMASRQGEDAKIGIPPEGVPTKPTKPPQGSEKPLGPALTEPTKPGFVSFVGPHVGDIPENASFELNAADRDYEIAERAAIAEHDGGLPADWADRLAELSYAPRPAGLPAAQWQDRLEAVWHFADRHANALHAAGWTFDDAFAVGGPWPRLDQRGAAWFCLDVRDLQISADCLRWRTATGAAQSFTRKPFQGE